MFLIGIVVLVVAVLATMATFAPGWLGLSPDSDERSSCTAAASQRADHPLHEIYQNYLETKVETGLLPGIILLVRSHKKGLWLGSAGVADRDKQAPITPCTRSRVGSITKIFTAVVVLKLVEQGKIALDKPISDYLPREIWTRLASGSQITVRQLLNHTSGLSDYVHDSSYLALAFGEPTRKWSMYDIIPYAYDRGGLFPPGQGFHYSNTNYILLGLIVLGASGRDPSELVTDWIIKPLGLSDTFYDLNNPVPDGTARGYVDYGGGLQDGTANTFAHYTPDGAVVSTVYDLSYFIEALFEGKLLSHNMLKEMTKVVDVPTARFGRTKYGLGLRFWDTPYGQAWGHSGQVVGYSADLFYFPDSKLSYALLVNASNGGVEQLIDQALTTEVPHLLFEPDKLPQ